MSWRDFFATKKSAAVENNYKLDLFEKLEDKENIISMSAIKKYFNSFYGVDQPGALRGFRLVFGPDRTWTRRFSPPRSIIRSGRLNDYRALRFRFEDFGAPGFDFLFGVYSG